MEKHLELIWKKIDGSLSPKETNNFNQLIQENTDFANLYKSQLSLNVNLKKIPTVSAPSSLLHNVLQNITVEKVIYSKEYSSFAGMKVIAISSLIVLGLIVITLMTFNMNLNATIYPEMTQWLNKLSLPTPLKGIESYSIYLLVLLPGLVLMWLDKMFRREPMQVRTAR